MRCPKCGYNSFDHLNSCKKCGKELLEYKQRYGIKSVLFPGQMKPPVTAGAETGDSMIDDVVAAASVAVAGGAVAGAVREKVAAEPSTSEADDFGFDFMGESEEEEDLSFDELFEEAPVDEDVEETLTGPKAAAETEDVAEFSFDSASEDEPASEPVTADAELDKDFGFDLDDSAKLEAGAGPAEDLAADDFELPPADEEGFDFNTDEIEFGETAEDAETEGDPKNPFELPESPQVEGAPEHDRFFFNEQPLPIAEDESALLLAESDVETVAPSVESVAVADEFEDLTSELFFETDVPPQDEDAEPPAVVLESEAAAIDESVADVAASTEGSDESAAEAVAEVAVELDGGSSPEEEPEVATIAAAGSVAAAAVMAMSEDVAPSAVALDDSQKYQHLLPPLASRVLAFCCDLLLLSAVSLSFIVAAETAMSGGSDRLLPSFATLIDLSIPYFLVLFSLAFGYFTLFHFLVGQTPGKMLAGLRVETLEGEPLVFSQAFLRSVGGLLQLLPAGLGYLVALFSPDRRGWNDRLAGTRLISLKGGLKV